MSHALGTDRARRFADNLGVPLGGAFAVLAAMVLMLGAGGLDTHRSPTGDEGDRARAGLAGEAGGASPSAAAAPSTTPPTTPAPSMMARPGASALIPPGTDCLGCHSSGGGIVPTVPPLAHPLSGWQNCTACHARDGLVQTAPGHTGIHADECLICHTKATVAAPPEPHPGFQGIGCLHCHGATAPLPASMLKRTETTCWLCHPASTAPVPIGGSSPEPGSPD